MCKHGTLVQKMKPESRKSTVKVLTKAIGEVGGQSYTAITVTFYTTGGSNMNVLVL